MMTELIRKTDLILFLLMQVTIRRTFRRDFVRPLCMDVNSKDKLSQRDTTQGGTVAVTHRCPRKSESLHFWLTVREK
jgi:hypothetical protein